jgi:predicted molibdopterin-dependent oxidoreductase YjgC
MISIKVDNIDIAVEEGQTILEASRKAGISIPTLCHMDGVEHYSSCMVCMVRDRKKNAYVPSCTALAQEGMDIDASGSDVLELRKKALELLLSEHRAECEAPCRVVCPAGYNIPVMNRLLAAGKFREATELVISELDSPEIRCLTCPGYCENACRRKKVDKAVSIRKMKIFISENLDRYGAYDHEIPLSEYTDPRKRFSSRIGKLDENELKEWLKECPDEEIRHDTFNDFESAEEEAKSCMHCDCRAAEDCRLRELAQSTGLKDKGIKVVNAPIAKKINKNTGLIFENAKCIKCGLCVRVCEDSTDEPALCFIHRGFVSIISEPLTEEFDNILKTQTDKVISVCPTGALAKFNK